MTIGSMAFADPRATGRRSPRGAGVAGDEALQRVARAADFLAAQVAREEPIYGVSTGFGSNADKLLGAHPLRDELPGDAVRAIAA
jgi:histidine ammonia-lyase